ncbi:hypothetical protein Bca4012_091038 [Brassica carinata]
MKKTLETTSEQRAILVLQCLQLYDFPSKFTKNNLPIRSTSASKLAKSRRRPAQPHHSAICNALSYCLVQVKSRLSYYYLLTRRQQRALELDENILTTFKKKKKQETLSGFALVSLSGSDIEAPSMTLDLDAGGGVARRRRRCSTSTMLLVPFCSFFVLDLLISPVVSSSIGSALYTGDSRSFRSSLTSSIIISRTLLAAVLHRLSLHPPPQVLLLSLDPEASTTSGCGIPLLSRRSGSAPQCMRGTSSSRCKSTISIPSRRCPEGFYCGSGEIRHTYTTLAPSLDKLCRELALPDAGHLLIRCFVRPIRGLFSSSDEHYGRRSPHASSAILFQTMNG